MDATLKLWVVIVAVGLLNYLSRLSFIAVFARRGSSNATTRGYSSMWTAKPISRRSRGRGRPRTGNVPLLIRH